MQKAYSLTSFDGFGPNEATTRAIAEERHAAPGPIREQIIPIAMSRRNVIGIARTGSGKTAVFASPILHHLAADERPAHTAQSLPPTVTHNAH